MSLRSRARALQRANVKLTYQQALERIRGLGDAPAALAKRTGWPLKKCDAYLLDAGSPKRASVRTDLPAERGTLTRVCEELRAATLARAVCLLDEKGNWLVLSGLDAIQLLALPREMRVPRRDPEGITFDEAAGIHIYTRSVPPSMTLIVLFDDRTSTGLVSLRARQAAAKLERMLLPAFAPPRGGASGSGAPGQISAFDALVDPFTGRRTRRFH